MAQLKDLIVSGASRFIGDIFADRAQLTTLNAPESSGSTSYGPGTSGQVLKTNGSSIYWAADNNTTYTLSGLGGIGTVSASGTAPLTLSASKSGTTVTLTGSIAALSTSAAGYVAKAPNDTKKFLRGDASWATIPWDSITQTGANNIEEGTSDFTDNTELFSSYASNNGFADTNATGKVYKRDAIHMYNYVKTKLAVTNNNVSVGWNTETTIATIGGTAIKIKIPANPNTNTDTLVKQTASTTAGEYKLLATASTSPTSGNAAEAIYNADVTINPNTKAITATTYKVTSNGTITYNSSNGCIEIIV